MPSQTTNPFRIQPPPVSRRSTPARSSRWALWLGLLATSLTVLVLLWFARQASWLPGPLRGMLSLPGMPQQVFVSGPGMNQKDARALYRKALASLQDGSYDQALSEFKQLEGVYPGLEDMIWLHEAEAYTGLGNEWAVQKKLTTLVEKHPDSALKAVSLYRIGQSQFRGSEWAKAQETFRKVREQHPNGDYAIGSLYYLGAATAKEQASQSQAIAPLKEYLTLCPDCKFSGNAAELLEKLQPKPTPHESGLIGLAYASASKDIKKTLAALSKAPFSQTWLALGRTQIRAGQKPAGVQTLMRGLPQAKDTKTAQTATDLIIAYSPDHATKVARLDQLAAKHLPTGGDYILWRLSEFNPGSARTYYESILRDYPQGDYAPESGWRLLWPLLSNGRNAEFLSQGQQYLEKYPYARSAPKVLFWQAKLQEQSAPSTATKLYQRLTEQYPSNYYAFRAFGRLRVLTEGKPDPGWTTVRNREYPPAGIDLNTLNILPPAQAFAADALGQARREAATELQAIGAAEDTRLLVTEATGSLPAAVDSWAFQTSGDRAKGLRTIRDALDKQSKEVFLTANGQPFKSAGTSDELKLLYPVYFSDSIRAASKRAGLDPFLIQALMREESYFNEFAISTSNARGLMQLLPSTAQEVAQWESMSGFRVSDLFLPETNIRLGSRYLGYLHETFNQNSMPSVGAYNGGPGAMKRWVNASPYIQSDPDMFVEKIPYEQSRDYIKKVFGSWWNYHRLYGSDKGLAN